MPLTVLAALSAGAALATGGADRPRVSGLSHVALKVGDLEKSRAFYEDFLGYPARLVRGPDGTQVLVVALNGRQSILLRPGLQADREDRLEHVALETSDVDGMRRYLEARGTSGMEPIATDVAGHRTFRVKDPEGRLLAFTQAGPETRAPRAARGRPTPISGLARHAGVLVGDLPPAQRFYGDLVGLQEIWRGSRSGTELSWTNMKVPDGTEYIEFMLYGDLPAPTARGSAHHVCLEVPDVEKAKAELLKRPYAATYTRPLEVRVGTNRKRQLNLFDPDGTRLELMEPNTIDGTPTPPSTAPPPRRYRSNPVDTAHGDREFLLLWPDGAPGAVGAEPQDRPKITIYRAAKESVNGSAPANGAAVVVCPGGGYRNLASDHEGRQVARWLNQLGVSAFVLQYRVGPRYRHPAPLQDVQRAIRIVRARATEFGVDPRRLGVLGFSAGGHLASTAGTLFEEGAPPATDPIARQSARPDFMVLAYPVISLTAKFAHGGSVQHLLGEPIPSALAEELSTERRVTDRTPPAFLFHTADDASVPVENSVAFAQALRTAGVPVELHVFPKGRHGVGLARPDAVLSQWPRLAAAWMRSHGLLDGSRATATATSPALRDAWPHSRPIRLDTTSGGADVAGDVRDYPLAVRLDASTLDFAQARPDGADIRFSRDGGDPLPHAIELWDAAARKALVWVKLDVKGNDATQSFLLHWGNPNATDTSDSKAVFATGEGFAGVWHFGEEGNTREGGYRDATANEAHATGVRLDAGAQAEGRLGKGLRLRHAQEQWAKVDGDKRRLFDLTTRGTLSIWAKATAYLNKGRPAPNKSTPGYETMFAKGDNSWRLQKFGIRDGHDPKADLVEMCVEGSSPKADLCVVGTTDAVPGQWFHYVAVHDFPEARLYVNGVLEAVDTFDLNWTSGDHPVGIGNQSQFPERGRFWDGVLDEARVLNVPKDGHWIKLDFESQRDGSRLLVFDPR